VITNYRKQIARHPGQSRGLANIAETRELAMKRSLLAAALIAGAAFLMPRPAAASASFDGRWSVVAKTETGKCDPYLGYQLVIIGGRVLSPQAGGVSGRVTPAGFVSVTIRGSGAIVVGSGRLVGGDGSGRWMAQSPSGRCTGEWQAKRRA
jgi:hypothetical protein